VSDFEQLLRGEIESDEYVRRLKQRVHERDDGDLRRKHGRRRLLAKNVPAYVQQLEDTIDALRHELAISAGRSGQAAKDGYERGHAEGRQYERTMRG
jgi:hypothetical protein